MTEGQARRKERNADIVRLYREGRATLEIAKRYQITQWYVVVLLRAAGVVTDRRLSPDGAKAKYLSGRRLAKTARNQQIARAHSKGATLRDLAAKYGISAQRVHQIVRAALPSGPGQEKT